jgi:xylose isomerase
VSGLTAVELNVGQHLSAGDAASVIEAARHNGLRVSALNVRFDPERFARGALAHPRADVRAAAVDVCRSAVDLAVSHEVDHVIVWPGPDGFDYPFQVEYARLWDHTVEGFARIAQQAPSIRVSIEYKPSEPRRISLVRSMSDALAVARESGCDNLGVTLDFCHALMAGESPAAAAAIATRAGKLFGVHLNDGYGPADDGLMVGSVHLTQLLELMWQLRKAEFRSVLYFDTFPERVDPVAECSANVAMMKRLWRALDRIDADELAAAQDAHDAVSAQRIWTEAVLGER